MATKSTALSIFMVSVLVFHIKMTASAFQGSENFNSHWKQLLLIYVCII